MGRPLNSRYFGDAVDSIKVSHHFRVGQSEVAGGDDTYIVRQRSSNKFLVADTSGMWEEILTLVDKDAGTLVAGEFRLDGVDAEGTPYNVVRLYNRTLRLGSADGTYVKAPWSIDGAFPDLAITGVTLVGNDPVVILVGSTTGLVAGDTVTIDGVVGTTELNGNSYTVGTVVADTSFVLVGTDSALFTPWVSDGTVSGVGGGGIDTQAS